MTPLTRHQSILGLGLIAMVVCSCSFGQMNPREPSWPALWSHESAAADPVLAELRHRANMSLARLVEAGQIVD